MGSNSRKRSLQVLIRLNHAEIEEVSRRAKDTNLTVQSYLRSIAINGIPPQFGKESFRELLSDVKGLKRSIESLYGMAKLKEIKLIDFDTTIRAINGMLEQIQTLDEKLELNFGCGGENNESTQA